MTAAIRVDHVSKRFRIPLDKSTTIKYRFTHLRSSGRYYQLDALHDISFDVPPGQFLGIIGSNGCGKSTLLKILAGIYVPSGGSVSVDGRVSPFLELGVGFNPELTARENVFVNGAILGLTRSELRERFDDIIDFADLQDFVDQKLKNFSSGMQVRLAFSVAIQARAEILLMDEVLAVGDARFQEKCFDVFWRYKREGKTVVLVTHDLGAIENYSDRAILMDHGRIIADGLGSEVVTSYRRRVEASFDVAAPTASAGEDAGLASVQHPTGVVITAVRIVDASGQRTGSVPSGSKATIEVEFTSTSAVGEIVCTIGLHRPDGLHLAGSDTRADGLTITAPPAGGRGCVAYAIDKMPFPAGSYAVSASLADQHTGHVYDDRPMITPFRVTADTRPSGLVELEGHWIAD